jgi:hypothetical protein
MHSEQYLLARQKEGESLQDYTRQFKMSTEILEFHLGGPIILGKYVKTSMNGYDAIDFDKTNMMIQQASERMFAFLYLENLDQDKYGSILQNLNSQKSLGNDQYLRTIVKTNNVLSNHKFDINKVRKQEARTQTSKANQEQGG